MSNTELNDLILKLQQTQNELQEQFGITDIYSNSKFYEIMIANELDHTPIAGHSGTRNGKNSDGEFEYKHFKESSSNHSWAFNDYSDTTIEKLKGVKSVVFAHIDDTNRNQPKFDWCLKVDGDLCSKYLKYRTDTLLKIQPKGKPNARRMINFSANQIERDLKISKTFIEQIKEKGRFSAGLAMIIEISNDMEKITGISQILTSNKFWEMLVAMEIGHRVLSEQSGHDAIDKDGRFYEYKVATNPNWNFQDISESVLGKYLTDEKIILAIVDKHLISLKEIHIAESKVVVNRLREKLAEKEIDYKKRHKEIRRISASLSRGDLQKINAQRIFP